MTPFDAGRLTLISALFIACAGGCGDNSHQQVQRRVPPVLPTEGILFEIQVIDKVGCGVIQLDETGDVYWYPCGNLPADAPERDLHIPGFADTAFDWLHDSTELNGEGGILLNRIGDSMLIDMYQKALNAGREVLPPVQEVTWDHLTLRIAAFTPDPATGALTEVLLLYTSDGLYQCRRGSEAGELFMWLYLLYDDMSYRSRP